jgi:hypothetical protein
MMSTTIVYPEEIVNHVDFDSTDESSYNQCFMQIAMTKGVPLLKKEKKIVPDPKYQYIRHDIGLGAIRIVWGIKH